MSNTWQDNDEVITNYKTIVQSQKESYLMGYEEAIAMVINVCRSMYNEFDQATLEELEQRIV
jgi:hypothetical protein